MHTVCVDEVDLHVQPADVTKINNSTITSTTIPNPQTQTHDAMIHPNMM